MITRPDAAQLDRMDVAAMGQLALELLEKNEELAIKSETARQEIEWCDAKIEKLTFELALSRRARFAAQSEQFDNGQKMLFEEDSDMDLGAIEAELETLKPAVQADEKKKPKRAALPANLPHREHRHEPDNTVCSCGCQRKRIGEDVSVKLDYIPGVVMVDRHIRGKWTCEACEKIVQAPVAPEVIDKGLPTSGLLAHVLVAKYQDRLNR